MDEFRGLDELMEVEKVEEKVEAEEKPKRRPYYAWEVGGEVYKLVLTTDAITTLERKYKRNLLMLISDDGIPPLSTMLTIVQGAMLKYHHGLNANKVKAIYDTYIEEGGSQADFMTDVVMPTFSVSGFFTQDMTEEMMEQKDLITAI